MSAADSLIIVGLGNPGPKHAGDRHNVGFWFADLLATELGARFAQESRLLAEECRGTIAGRAVRVVKPQTFMNRSGQAIRAVLDFYKSSIDRLVVVHDELDLPPGVVRFKRGGGHGGHNGLRDILTHCEPDFVRVRIGIGHPGHKDQVTGYVLSPPEKAERLQIQDGIDAALKALETFVTGGLEKATQQLHTATPRPDGDFGPAG